MSVPADDILSKAAQHRATIGPELGDRVMASYHAAASRLTAETTAIPGGRAPWQVDRAVDRIVTSRVWGFPIMILLLWGVLWLTVAGANVPSSMLATLTMDHLYGWLKGLSAAIGLPWWLDGFLLDGVYLATAWVISVMLPPMAIFFPIFTLLEDLGYLPRVAFNLDRLFNRAGAHGKQALTMMMGFGCNAAGVVSTRIIDSPRERLIAIITNNFSICNGRWPTLILMGTIFIGALAPSGLGTLAASASVVATCLIGIGFALLASWGLSRTVLKGESSTFSLELPPYRPPRILSTIYTSLVDRTLIVLWRAVVMAAPAGAAIWLSGNIQVGGNSIAGWAVEFLGPLGWIIGLNGVILFAYIIAIPANEIIVPTILMLSLTLAINDPSIASLARPGVMIELEEDGVVHQVLTASGWTLLTGINLMLFSLLHNPCSTTILTIWRETRSLKWTAMATLLPLALGFVVCALTATVARLMGWV